MSARERRLGALVTLAVGLALGATYLDRSRPREQPIVVRLSPELARTTEALEASFTPVGEREPVHGVTLALDGSERAPIRLEPRLRNGDYLLTIELTSTHSVRGSGGKTETIQTHRVTLNGEQTLVFVDESSE
ncbi:MAG TPA: hypothetical protein VKY73_17140 [Polyangiaceae bacterium]|nr:hypothetical protein [Polyangiaceae bacterium]